MEKKPGVLAKSASFKHLISRSSGRIPPLNSSSRNSGSAFDSINATTNTQESSAASSSHYVRKNSTNTGTQIRNQRLPDHEPDLDASRSVFTRAQISAIPNPREREFSSGSHKKGRKSMHSEVSSGSSTNERSNQAGASSIVSTGSSKSVSSSGAGSKLAKSSSFSWSRGNRESSRALGSKLKSTSMRKLLATTSLNKIPEVSEDTLDEEEIVENDDDFDLWDTSGVEGNLVRAILDELKLKEKENERIIALLRDLHSLMNISVAKCEDSAHFTFLNGGGALILLRILGEFRSEQIIVQLCLNAILRLIEESGDGAQKFVEAGVGQALLSSLNAIPSDTANSFPITVECEEEVPPVSVETSSVVYLRILSSLACTDILKTLFIDCAQINTILDIMDANLSDAKTQSCGSQLIAAVYAGSDSIKHAVAEARTTKQLIKAMETHPSNLQLIKKLCDLFRSFSESTLEEMQCCLIGTETSSGLITALRHHKKDQGVVVNCFVTLCNIQARGTRTSGNTNALANRLSAESALVVMESALLYTEEGIHLNALFLVTPVIDSCNEQNLDSIVTQITVDWLLLLLGTFNQNRSILKIATAILERFLSSKAERMDHLLQKNPNSAKALVYALDSLAPFSDNPTVRSKEKPLSPRAANRLH
mmetsp:Transcript_7277/g.13136  ORF Transcript_7277/g.13136 Transcript_7277/m.13136 type:complete len:652 (-) Transcript_7277:33-1988(-)